MNFEYDIFKKLSPDYNKLIDYGFVFNNDMYEYKKKLVDNLWAIINVEKDKVFGKIYDFDVNCEYTMFRIETQSGVFVNNVREEYISLLMDIAKKCFSKKNFISDQANRISFLISKKYGDDPIFKFENYPDFGIFENNGKWYALIMNVLKTKFGFNDNSEVEVINLKLDKNRINLLLKKEGFYEAYHMNKKSWISIILDDTINDDLIMELIDESYSYTVSTKMSINEWVMPLNPHFFDVFQYFDSTDVFYWDKKKSFKNGDIIYMYVTKPIGAIMYKCLVDDITDDFMIIKKICKFDDGRYGLEFLKKFGLNSIRGARHIPAALSKELKKDLNN